MIIEISSFSGHRCPGIIEGVFAPTNQMMSVSDDIIRIYNQMINIGGTKSMGGNCSKVKLFGKIWKR